MKLHEEQVCEWLTNPSNINAVKKHSISFFDIFEIVDCVLKSAGMPMTREEVFVLATKDILGSSAGIKSDDLSWIDWTFLKQFFGQGALFPKKVA